MNWTASKYSPLTLDGYTITIVNISLGSDSIFRASLPVTSNGLNYHAYGTTLGEAVVNLMNFHGC